MAMIEFHDVSKLYPADAAALRDVSLSIAKRRTGVTWPARPAPANRRC